MAVLVITILDIIMVILILYITFYVSYDILRDNNNSDKYDICNFNKIYYFLC